MMKHCRLIAFALALLLCLCAPAVADEPIEYRAGDYRYVLLADGTAEIVAYTLGVWHDLAGRTGWV